MDLLSMDKDAIYTQTYICLQTKRAIYIYASLLSMDENSIHAQIEVLSVDKKSAYIYHFCLSVDNEGLYVGFTPLSAVAKCFHKEKTPSTGVNGVKV